MQLDQRPHDRQTDTHASRSRGSRRSLHEWREQARQKLGFNARTGVFHAEDCAIAAALQSRDDLTSSRSEFECVRQQVDGDLAHPRGVCVHPKSWLERALKLYPRTPRTCVHGRQHLHEQTAQLQRLALDLQRASCCACQIEQVVYQARFVPCVSFDDAQSILHALICGNAGLEHLHRHGYGRQRVAQFVGHHREESILGSVRFLSLG